MPASGDPLGIELQNRLVDEGLRIFEIYIDQFFPAVKGTRQPIISERISEEEEWNFLEETYRKWVMWKNEEIEEDSDVLSFDRNEDGAQDRLAELRLKYSDGANGEVAQ